MTKLYSVLLVAVAVSTLGYTAAPVTTPSTRCLASDTLTASRITWLKAVVTRTDTEMVNVRNTMGLLATQASKVKLVTTSSVCGTLADSLDTFRNQTISGRSAYAYEIGPSRYGVEDPADTTLRNAERVFGIYTTSFARVAATTVEPWMMSQFEWDPIRP